MLKMNKFLEQSILNMGRTLNMISVSCESESHPCSLTESIQTEVLTMNVEVPSASFSNNNRVVPGIALNNYLNKPRKATMDSLNINKTQLESVTLQSSVSTLTLTPQTWKLDRRNVDKHSRTLNRNKHYKDDLDLITHKLANDRENLYHEPLIGFKYYEKANTNKYLAFLHKGVLIRLSNDDFNGYVRRHLGLIKKDYQCYISKNRDTLTLVIAEHIKKWSPQSLTDALRSAYDAVSNTVDSTLGMLQQARDGIAMLKTRTFKLLLIDVLALMLNLRDGFLTPGKVASTLLTLYTLHERYMSMYRTDAIYVEGRRYVPQSASITDILLGFAALGLSEKVLGALKNFTALTGKRIFDSDIIMETLYNFFEAIVTIIEWISEPYTGCRIIPVVVTEYIVGIIRYVSSGVYVHKKIKTVCDNYTKYCVNPQIMFDPTYRQRLMTEYKELKSDKDFMEYVLNSNNKYFANTWNLYESNVIKSVIAFDESRRDEPICIVFEGEAGTGKSMIMNQFVDLLRKNGLTTYCHAVPASEDGKDFYDDYDNQHVFVMDDVGQQGKSQWRYIINFVSPVKYPLPCATASKKNTKFFNSKIILCTTNCFMKLGGFTSSDCISEPEALFRRCHVINVERDSSIVDRFAQQLTYYKFDHINTKRWLNQLLYHCANDRVRIQYRNAEDADDLGTQQGFTQAERTLTFVYKLFKHIETAEENNRKNTAMALESMDRITEYVNNYQPQGYMDVLRRQLTGFLAAGADARDIAVEWTHHYGTALLDLLKEGCRQFSQAFDFVAGIMDNLTTVTKAMLTGGVLLAFGWCLWHLMISNQPESTEKMDVGFDTTSPEMKLPEHIHWTPQATLPERIETVKKFCRTVVVKNDSHDRSLDEVTQAIVSGNYVLFPAHLDAQNKYVDVFRTPEHYNNGHVEMENVKVKRVKFYPACDLAVYQFQGNIPLYKKCNNLFLPLTQYVQNPLMYLVNSSGVMPVLYGSSVVPNSERVTYSKYNGELLTFDHQPSAGYITPYSRQGGCGTVLVSADNGIVGYHVAGGSSCGFCVNPPQYVRDEIREVMLSGKEVDFELDDRVIPDFSGVRVRYQKPIEPNYINSETEYQPSIFHRDVNLDMKELERVIVEDHAKYTQVPVDIIDHKGPPIFDAAGTPKQTIKNISSKTFKRQGYITNEEFAYIEKCIDSMLIDFDELTDDVCAFGDENIRALNKDSSNGYHCAKGKDAYFDFENKIIKEEAKELFERVRMHAENDYYDYNDFMCRETFKDELRKSAKRTVPRTFRVLPLGHIWWTKKIFGRLMKHFSTHLHDYGVCVGYNPFLDTDRLAKKLLACEITGDADFGKWDGTIMAELIKRIMRLLGKHYTGDKHYVIDWLSATIAHSFVLVTDEIWATTHGLPSGTWLTLLMNCLINKSLTALTIFRNKKNASVHDFHSVVDYVVGDDKIIGASGEMVKVFNLLTIKTVAESLGMDCTNGDKTPITKASHPFANLTFVKRHFRQHPVLKRYIGNLSIDTILNTLQWENKNKDREESMNGKIRSMQIEAFIHSPALFHEITRICEKAYPFMALFDQEKIERILQRDDAYEQVLLMQGKDPSWMYV